MPPALFMIIRHAEKPENGSPFQGITPEGAPDTESLTTRGWQRAGALARYFCPQSPEQGRCARPDVVYAAGLGQGSNSQRPIQTVTPLVQLLQEMTPTLPFITQYRKGDYPAMMTDAMTYQGVVLISWEHKLIPALVSQISNALSVPQIWPDERFDVVWLLARRPDGWAFSQKPMLLLSGDQDAAIQ